MPSPGLGIALLADLAIRGISLRLKGERLRVRPKSKLTPELTQRIRQHKAELIQALRHQQAVDPACPLPGTQQRHFQRFATAQQELRKRGFIVLANKPEVVLSLLDIAQRLDTNIKETGHA